MSLLEVRNASKTFGSLVAVRQVSLSVQPGEMRAIIGPNGAGKTTFFNLITGFFRPAKARFGLTDKMSPGSLRNVESSSGWAAPSR